MNYFSALLQRYSTTAAAKPTARLSARTQYNKEKDESSDEQSCLKANQENAEPVQSPCDPNEVERSDDIDIARQDKPPTLGKKQKLFHQIFIFSESCK